MPNELEQSVLRKARESAETLERFFFDNSARIVECAAAMSSAFANGARLFAFGNGGSACDAQHIAVELMHPIVEKRKPLPALALPCDVPLASAIGNDQDFALVFAHQLRMLGKTGDIALGLSTSGKSRNVVRGLKAAREIGMLTIGFTGRDGGSLVELCEYAFVVPSFSIHRIQEGHVTLLHIVWDLIHVQSGEKDVL